MSEKIVYTAGVFDLFHHGHLNILRRSKALGDKLIVGVISDAGTIRYKSQLPIIQLHERLQIVQSIDCVDMAVVQRTTDPTPQLEIWRPQIFTHGDDWERLIEGHDTIERLGIEFVRLPYTQGISTSDIVARIRA